MSQSSQAVAQDNQAVGQIIGENAVNQGQLLRSFPVNFDFTRSKSSTRMVRVPINPPQGTLALIVLQGFNVSYVDEDYELENLQVSLRIEGEEAVCTGTLRDRNGGGPNNSGREWQGLVTGLVMFFSNAA